ncbi:MAG TPA: hypothetical protein VFB21_12590 [Chthonomonadaceae bacterium]|nr:hypothetical protein [Chthonomonadaceae bacterium]
MAALQAGIARAVITPPIGIAMSGFAGRGPAEGIHDELLATALALESGETRALVIAADLLYFPDPVTQEVKAEVARRTGVPASHILLCASHTHYGPTLTGDEGSELPADIAAYRACLPHTLAGIAQAALAQTQSVQIGFGVGESYIGVNRRERRPDGEIILGQNPQGPCDRQVGVIRLDTAEGQPFAALVNFACHPVSPAGRMRVFTADYVGVMRQMVEAFTGAACLFLQGAAGNINPVEMRPSLEPLRRLGVMLGGEVAKVFEDTRTAAAVSGIAVASRKVDLPGMTYPSISEGEKQVSALRAQVRQLEAQNDSEGTLWWVRRRLRQGEARLDSLRTGTPLPPVPAEMTALRFGDVALVTAPGEIFTETGMAVKARSPLPSTCFVGYTNGSIGYVPVPSAYPEGGYEVTHACQVDPEAAGLVEETALSLLNEMAADRKTEA